jgi:hypothetical protein
MPGQSPLSMMQPPSQPVRRRTARRVRRRRWPILAASSLVIAAVLALAWSWLWYRAAAVADRTLAGWVEREAEAGRVYSCGAQSIGGFPLRIEARCTDVAAAPANNQPPFVVKAKAITFTAEVWHPTRLIGDLSGPLTLAETGQPPAWIADWARARLIVRGLPPDPAGVSIQLDGTHLDRAGATGDSVFKAKSVDLQARIASGSPHDHPVIEANLRLSGAAAPAFHPLLAQPMEAEADAVLRGLKDLSPKPWAERFREVQAAGGDIEIKSMHIAQNDVIVVGNGKLSINANGKLDGLVRVAIVGLEQLVPRLGIDRLIGQGIDRLAGSDGAAAQGASALDRLIPGLSGALRQSATASLIENLKKMGQPSSIDKKPATVLPLRFVDGSIYLGMLRVGEVPALF